MSALHSWKLPDYPVWRPELAQARWARAGALPVVWGEGWWLAPAPLPKTKSLQGPHARGTTWRPRSSGVSHCRPERPVSAQAEHRDSLLGNFSHFAEFWGLNDSFVPSLLLSLPLSISQSFSLISLANLFSWLISYSKKYLYANSLQLITVQLITFQLHNSAKAFSGNGTSNLEFWPCPKLAIYDAGQCQVCPPHHHKGKQPVHLQPFCTHIFLFTFCRVVNKLPKRVSSLL